MNFSRNKKYIFALLLLFGVSVFLMTLGKAIYRTGYIITQVIPDAPRLFEWGKYDVSVEKVELDLSGKNIPNWSKIPEKELIYIYLPVGVIRPAFVILIPGFTPDGALDRRLVNLARAFAGAGIGAAIPDSNTIRLKTFSREDIELIKNTFNFLQDREYVDRERIGICGFSVAGSYALLAASELGSSPLFVFSLGGYFDLGELVVQILSKNASYDGSIRPWEPNPMPREVVSSNFIEHIGEKNTEKVGFENLSFHDAREYVQLLPEEILFILDSLSPSTNLSSMRTRVFLMHDRNDDIIPVEEFYKLRDSLPGDIPVHHSEFSIISHVEPKSFFSLDILKFSWQVLRMVKILL